MVVSRKKILIVSLNLPYPLSHGGALAQYFFLKELSLIHDITFCSHAQSAKDKMHLEQLASSIPQLKIIYSTEKEQKSSVYSLLRSAYQKLKRGLVGRETVSDDLSQLDFHSNLFFLPKEFTNFFQQHIINYHYDVIQLEFFESTPLFALLPVPVKKIYICHEIKSKRILGLICKPENVAYKNFILKSIKVMEDGFLKLADEIIVFTGEDKDYLALSNLDSTISPFGIPGELIVRKKSSDIFNRFLFMGNETMFPNREGLSWFLEKIYLPNSKSISWPVVVLGEWTKEFKEKYRHPGVKFEGLVDKTDYYYEQSVLISPVLSGSGLRTKILLAFANYIPVLSTPFASEGLNEKMNNAEHILHFQNSHEFICHWKKIENNPSVLKMIAENARDFYDRKFDRQQLVQTRNNLY